MTKRRPFAKQKRPEDQSEEEFSASKSFIEELILDQLNDLKYTASVAEHGLNVRMDTEDVGSLESQVRFFSGDKASVRLSYLDPTQSEHVLYQSPDFLNTEAKKSKSYDPRSIKEMLYKEFMRRVVSTVRKKLVGLEGKVRTQGSSVTVQLDSIKYGRLDIDLKNTANEYIVRKVDYFNKNGKKKTIYSI